MRWALCTNRSRMPSASVLLAQHDILLAPPALIQPAETGVAIAVRIGLTVLFPQQLQRQVWMKLPLPVHLGEVRHR